MKLNPLDSYFAYVEYPSMVVPLCKLRMSCILVPATIILHGNHEFVLLSHISSTPYKWEFGMN